MTTHVLNKVGEIIIRKSHSNNGFRYHKRFAVSMCLCGTLFSSILFTPAVSAITIEFDYRYDTHGFYTPERRNLMYLAASAYSGFTDQLSAISPQTGDGWSVTIRHPSLSGPAITLTDETIAADSLRIYAGASSSAPGVLGFAGTGWGLTATGSSQFEDAVLTRGQLNTMGSTATDYGIWGGSIWINSNNPWFYSEDETGLTSGQPDFLTTVTHEIGHILGFGEADSWFAQIDSGYFTGLASIAEYGSVVPVGPYSSHWAEGTMSQRNGVNQETMMDPSTPYGVRQLPTVLDYAGFEDIGWQLTPVPVPAGIWLFVSGLGLLLVRIKGKQ